MKVNIFALCHNALFTFNFNLLFFCFCSFFFLRLIGALGPLNSDWFEELTVRASEDGCDNSTAHKDKDIFKAPAKTPVLDSQMCSTPRIFRRRRPHSPPSGLEDTPNAGRQALFLNDRKYKSEIKT